MNNRVIMSVTNEVAFDQRVNRVAETLLTEGAEILIVGRKKKNSIECSYLPYPVKRFRMIFQKGPLMYAFFNIRLFFFLLFTKADILLANDLDTLLANYLVSKIKNVTIIYDSHEYFTAVPELQNRPFVTKIWQTIERKILPYLEYFYTVNRSIAGIYEKKYSVNVEVVRNLANKWNRTENCSRKRLNLPLNKFLIILQGSGINIDRGAEEAVLAMKYLNNSMLLIIGDGDVIQKLKNLVSKNSLWNKIRFMEMVPYNILMNYTCAADVGLTLDKETNLNYKYSLPNKLFDYIQAGVPVLGSSVCEVEKLIRKYNIGDIVTDHDPEHIANKLNEMFSDSDRIHLWKKNLQKAGEELCWENEEEKVIAIFRRAGFGREN